MENNIKKILEDSINKLEVEAKEYRLKIQLLIFELIINIIGWGLFIYLVGWLIALAVGLIIFGNNIGMTRQTNNVFKNILEMIKSK